MIDILSRKHLDRILGFSTIADMNLGSWGPSLEIVHSCSFYVRRTDVLRSG